MNLLSNEHPDHPLQRLAESNPAVARALGAAPRPKARRACAYLGADTLAMATCADNCGKGTRLKVFTCAIHGACTIAKRGEGMDACCRDCPDSTTRPRDPWQHPVRVPEPPPLDTGGVPPTSRRAVVTVAAGAAGHALLEFSAGPMARYAQRIGADFIVIDWPGTPAWPLSCKFAIARALDLYERVLFLDADVLVSPSAPDLFDVVPVGRFGAYDDLPEILTRSSGFMEEYQRLRESQGLLRCPVPHYPNTGVMVFDRAHRGILSVPPRPIPPLHCAEQHWWCARLHDSGAPVTLLPKWANYQFWTDKKLEHVPDGVLLHFAGMQHRGGQEQRLRLMREWAERLAGRRPEGIPASRHGVITRTVVGEEG